MKRPPEKVWKRMIYRVDATHPKIKKNDEEDETKRTQSLVINSPRCDGLIDA